MSAVQLSMDMPESARKAISDGRYHDAVDALVRIGVRPPQDLLDAVSAMAGKDLASGLDIKVQPYKGRTRVIVSRRGASVAHLDTED